ncbi:MAG: sigma-70 family RNA polymerase sigma factor [Desulfomonile tiedjei]|uniref:Sigma-70 family RNA polymerase sigma factor n=1 Tax=Desulfomonile tiedjei TaxID=2358 RepID=A0A9D6V5A7_9BACT|nr:sigma-70 family RNA polymerase sigma factor [Desulfomonile tiedjei]
MNTDGSLIERCNRGEKYAWEEFYRKFLPLVRLAVNRFAREEDKEDLTQETFIQLIKALKHYDSTKSLEPYIMEIARRVAIGHYRKTSASKRGGLNPSSRVNAHDEAQEQGYVSVPAQGEDQEASLIKAQESSLLRKSFQTLSEACRNLLGLRYDRGLAYQEIGDILKVKEATLRVKVARCLSILARRCTESGLGEASNR